jgi:hypothetical protein
MKEKMNLIVNYTIVCCLDSMKWEQMRNIVYKKLLCIKWSFEAET